MRYIVSWLIGLMMLGWTTVSAQQIPASTMFIENPFAFNPAVAGTDKCFKIRMDNRLQWLGFTDAPITNLVSAYGPQGVRPIGYGGTIIYDKTGPISTLKASGAFAYNFNVNFDIRVSFGLNLGFLQYRADGTKFEFDDNYDDHYAPYTVMASFQPDAGSGVFVYHHDWYVGLSAQQLFNNNLKLSDIGENNKLNRLKTHFYGLGGYRFKVDNSHWVIEPSLLMRKLVSIPFQMDVCGRVIYNQQIWGGLSVRNTFESVEDMSLMFGYIHERRIYVSVAYDFSFAKIRKYTAGTIELVLGYNFDEIGKGR